ncbi:hypothetical protein M9435_003317 [Picochlorum sp. BPE23]|nr:hypothetical protein M9435_003317 [Picochlorum sp. BPE23]
MKKWTDKLIKNLGVEDVRKKASFQGRGHKLGGAEDDVSSSSGQQSRGQGKGPTDNSGQVQPPRRREGQQGGVTSSRHQARPSRTEVLIDTSISSIGNVECESAMRHIVGEEKDHGAVCLRTVYKILSNILATPEDEKVRKLRLQNPKIQSCIVDVHGGMELLLGCGFEVVFEPASSDDASPQEEDAGEHGFLVLPKDMEDSTMDILRRVVRAIGIVLGLPQGDQPISSRPANKSSMDASEILVDRNTIIELPTPVDTHVPDWFFEQSSAEIKQIYRENREKMEQSKVLMTRAMREKLHRRNSSARHHSAVLRIRVRAPEGTKIVGDFARGEPVQALFAWVSDCLVDPMLEFDLIMPDRSKLGDARFELKTLTQLGLTESQTLNLAWMGDSVRLMKNTPAFRENL